MKQNVKVQREVHLSVRMEADDLERIERLAKLLSPYSPLSKGKTISAALVLAEKQFQKKAG